MGQRLGQHFLKDKSKIAKIIKALDLSSKDKVIEIGAGHGELTEGLLKNAGNIYAVEKDRNLYEFLKKKFNNEIKKGKLILIQGDAVEKVPKVIEKIGEEYKVAGNIPYYLTGKIFRVLGNLKNRPQKVVFLIQKEVGERICSGKGKMNLISASIKFWAEPSIVSNVKKGSFYPQPKVDSVIIKLDLAKKYTNIIDEDKYYKFVNVIFKNPRKTIKNNLISAGFKEDLIIRTFDKIVFNKNIRAHQLEVEDIIHLASSFDF